MTQADLVAHARKTAIALRRPAEFSKNTIHSIETGKSRPSLDQAIVLAHVFQLPVEEVFDYVEVPA